jgi:hypothetical protein
MGCTLAVMIGAAAGRRLLPLLVVLVVLVVLAASTVALAGTVQWGSAIQVPGTAGGGTVNSISCTAAGECLAGGSTDDPGGGYAFVAEEKGGVWGTAIEVPGMAALGDGVVSSVSCDSPGDCAAGGFYVDALGALQPFVVSEQDGVWGTATEVPTANAGGYAEVFSVSCGGPHDCAAVGFYSAGVDRYGGPADRRSFVVSEHGGVWGSEQDTPGAEGAISCGGAGNCVAGGSSPKPSHAFVVAEKNGTWGNGQKVPGMAALTGGAGSDVWRVSCSSPGNCAVAGDYTYGHRISAFVADERSGKWSKAIRVPGLAALQFGSQNVGINSVSCSSAGNCAAGGYYIDRAHKLQAFVVREAKGTWGNAIKVHGLSALNLGGWALVESVSCASDGNCAATGFYTDHSNNRHAFVVAERNGAWGTAVQVPGAATLGDASEGNSVSCGSAGDCAIGGVYRDGSNSSAFVTAP